MRDGGDAKSYRPRVVDAEVTELLAAVPAIAIEGPKAVGKTATAKRVAATVHRLDDPRQREVINGDLNRLTEGSSPILIDEWQRLPVAWDLVRRAVDDDSRSGRFLLTGSAAPRPGVTHSGAGRIVTIRMRPMTLSERGVTSPTVSLQALLTGNAEIHGATDVSLASYVEEICASGLPDIHAAPPRGRRARLDGYLERIVDRELPDEGFTVARPASLRAWLTAYAAATSTTTSYERIRDAATSGTGDKPAKTTTIPYREALVRLWVVDPLPAWLPSRNPVSRLTSAPKHHLADPALAARLLGMEPAALLAGEPGRLREGTLLGALFESLVTHEVRVFAQAAEAHVFHLRTRGDDHEVDLIVQRRDGRVLAIEVKLAQTVGDADVRHLHWLRRTIGDDLIDAMIITTGNEAYRRSDGVAVVPCALLGA